MSQSSSDATLDDSWVLAGPIKCHKRPTSYLLTIRQQEGESLRDYVKCFNKVVLEIDEANDQVIIMTFQAGLNNPNLVFSLGKMPPTSMTDLLFKA